MAVSDFTINTDYPIDKVVLARAITRTVPTATNMSESAMFTIPHTLGFAPLCIGVFSFDGWNTSYAFGNGPYFFNSNFMTYMMEIGAVIESTPTELRIHAINWGGSKSVQFRIVGLAPVSTPEGMPEYSDKDDFVFNSDYNYMKIIDSGSRSRSNTGTHTITHGLGYEPHVLVFSEFDGVIRRVASENFIGVTGVATEASVSTSNLQLAVVDNFGGLNVTMHYRIYADE